jgi:hypothetical protein
MLKQADESVPPVHLPRPGGQARRIAGRRAGKDDVRRKSDDFLGESPGAGAVAAGPAMVGMNVAVVPPSQILQTPAGRDVARPLYLQHVKYRTAPPRPRTKSLL